MYYFFIKKGNILKFYDFKKGFKMIKKLLVSAAFLVACFAQNPNDNTLNFAVSKNVGELNPHLYSPNEMFAQDMVYEGLVKFENGGKISPWLAKSWSVSDDGKIYTFELRRDVVFSNGEKFNAAAVKANFDAVLANRKRHEWLELARLIDGCEATGEFEVKLSLKNAYEPTLRELSLIRPFRFIAPSAMKDGGTKDGVKEPVGTGAWRLVATERGVSDTFVRNDKFYGELPKISKIVARVIPEPNTKIIALKTGEVDLVYGGGQIPIDSFNELKKEFGWAVSQPVFTLVIALNSAKFPTNDEAVRKALNLSANKEPIAQKIFFNAAKKADFLFDASVHNADINASAYNFDVKKANQILDAAGYATGKDGVRYKDGKALEIELVYIGSNAVQKAIGEVLRANFSKIGVRLNLKADEATIFYKKQKTGDFGAVFNSTWGAPYDPQAFLASMRLPAHADYQAQLGLIGKAQIDEKIERIALSLDAKERRDLTRDVLTRLHESAVYIPIVYETTKALWNKRVKGVEFDALKDRIPFEKMSLDAAK